MTISYMDKIVKYQVSLTLKDRALTISDIGNRQYKDELYQMALKLLVELR